MHKREPPGSSARSASTFGRRSDPDVDRTSPSSISSISHSLSNLRTIRTRRTTPIACRMADTGRDSTVNRVPRQGKEARFVRPIRPNRPISDYRFSESSCALPKCDFRRAIPTPQIVNLRAGFHLNRVGPRSGAGSILFECAQRVC